MSRNMRLHNRIADGLRRGKRRVERTVRGLPSYWWADYKEHPEPTAFKTKPAPGARVRLHGTFLRNTGQMTGDEGGRVWYVHDCQCGLCQNGRHVAVDQIRFTGEHGLGPFNQARPSPWRHIAWANLEDVDLLERLERDGRAALLEKQRETP